MEILKIKPARSFDKAGFVVLRCFTFGNVTAIAYAKVRFSWFCFDGILAIACKSLRMLALRSHIHNFSVRLVSCLVRERPFDADIVASISTHFCADLGAIS